MSQQWVFLSAQACHGVSAQMQVTLVQEAHVQVLTFEQALEQLNASWQLVLPVEAVACLALQLPTRKARWLRQALTFAVEEQLAEDVELMHLALGQTLADGRQRVYGVNAAWLRSVLALCAECAPSAIKVDADMLPASGTSLLWLGTRWLLGGEGAARLAFDRGNWPVLAERGVQPVTAYCSADEPALEGVEVQVLPGNAYQWLASLAEGVDLAQGEFAPKNARAGSQLWRPLAYAAALCVALQWSFNLLQGWYLQQQAQAYASASESLYRELFPQDSKLIDLRAQLDQHLQQNQASTSQWHSVLGPVAQSMEGAAVRIDQLDFNANRADVTLQVWAPGFAELEQVRQRLEQEGQSVQMGSASRESDGVAARMVVGG